MTFAERPQLGKSGKGVPPCPVENWDTPSKGSGRLSVVVPLMQCAVGEVRRSEALGAAHGLGADTLPAGWQGQC
jgi:hypothetical protein